MDGRRQAPRLARHRARARRLSRRSPPRLDVPSPTRSRPMKHIVFHLDFISPYAYLAFEHLPEALEGLSYERGATGRSLLGALLQHHGQLGPAEIPAKRAWTYRHVLWLGQAHGIPIEMPATHPYNPLPHLRLALADHARRRHQPLAWRRPSSATSGAAAAPTRPTRRGWRRWPTPAAGGARCPGRRGQGAAARQHRRGHRARRLRRAGLRGRRPAVLGLRWAGDAARRLRGRCLVRRPAWARRRPPVRPSMPPGGGRPDPSRSPEGAPTADLARPSRPCGAPATSVNESLDVPVPPSSQSGARPRAGRPAAGGEGRPFRAVAGFIPRKNHMRKLRLTLATTTTALLATATAITSASAQSDVTLYGRVNTTVENQKIGEAQHHRAVQQLVALRLPGRGGPGRRPEDRLRAGERLRLRHRRRRQPFFARRSEVDLSGDFGRLRLGRWIAESYFATADYVSLHNHDTGSSADALYAYVSRDTNKVAYRTPVWHDFTLEGSVGLHEQASGTPDHARQSGPERQELLRLRGQLQARRPGAGRRLHQARPGQPVRAAGLLRDRSVPAGRLRPARRERLLRQRRQAQLGAPVGRLPAGRLGVPPQRRRAPATTTTCPTAPPRSTRWATTTT